MAYGPEAWHDLFVTVGGASAALAGLLLVAVSLNLEHVLRYRSLPTAAASSMSLLVAAMIASRSRSRSRSLPLLGAGISLIAGAGGGLYWVLAWVVVALAIATFNAWVLLVEIRR